MNERYNAPPRHLEGLEFVHCPAGGGTNVGHRAPHPEDHETRIIKM